MEMKNTKEYLAYIRELVGKDQIIIVPNTVQYYSLLNDFNIILKQPDMNLTKYGRVIKRNKNK